MSKTLNKLRPPRFSHPLLRLVAMGLLCSSVLSHHPVYATPGEPETDSVKNESGSSAKADSAGRQSGGQSGSQSGSQLSGLLRQASRARTLVLPGSAELVQAQALFEQLLRGASATSGKIQASASALQMQVVDLGPFTVLMEAQSAQRGRGLFAFRRTASADKSGKPGSPALRQEVSQDVLQVPHAFKDEMTRDIGLALFAEAPFAAVAFNTVPRRFPDANGNDVVADMAHIEGTYFLAFTRASASVLSQGRTVQIHGFEQGKRKTSKLAEADIILSAGHNQPPASLRQAQQNLQQSLGRNIELYDVGVKELGATTNVEAAALRAMGYERFIHVEMSRPMRQAMRDDRQTRRHWINSILGAASS